MRLYALRERILILEPNLVNSSLWTFHLHVLSNMHNTTHVCGVTIYVEKFGRNSNIPCTEGTVDSEDMGEFSYVPNAIRSFRSDMDDCNMNMLSPVASRSPLQTTALECNFRQLVTKTTSVTCSSENLIDLLFVSHPEMFERPGCVDVLNS